MALKHRVEADPLAMMQVNGKRALSERKPKDNSTELSTLKWYEIKTNDFS